MLETLVRGTTACPENLKGSLQPLPAPSTIPFEELTTDFATCLPWSKDTHAETLHDAVQVCVCADCHGESG